MEKSKELCQKAGVMPRLELGVKLEGGGVKLTGPHKVKVLEEKIVMGTEYQTGKEREEMRYILEEDGVKKTYNVPVKDKNEELHYLIQRFAEVEEGEEIILEMKRKGAKNYVSLERMNSEEVKDDEIPVINEQE